MNTQQSFFNIIYVKCIKNGLAQMSKTKITKKNKELNIFKGTGVGTGEGGGSPGCHSLGGDTHFRDQYLWNDTNETLLPLLVFEI